MNVLELSRNRATLFIACLGVLAGPAYGDFLEEIVVTAQKREQKLQDVGISITAMTGEKLAQLGYSNSTEIVQQAPNVMLASPNGLTSNIFTIRGVSQNDFADHQESPNAVYIDGVYISQTSGANFLMFDLERVELLRGPQGTLFGRNATGGLVHYITSRPSQGFEAFGNLTLGSFNQRKFDGAISGGLGETTSARLSVAVNKHDGIFENNYEGGAGCSVIDPTLVCPPGQDTVTGNDKAVRLQFLFEPSESFSLLLNGRATDQDIDTGIYNHLSSKPTGPFGAGERLPADEDFWGTCPGCNAFGYIDTTNNFHQGSWNFQGFNKMDTNGLSATLDWEVGGVVITSISDVSTLNKDYIEDSDVMPLNFFNFFLQSDVKQISQELRIAGNTDSLRWVAGLYYLDIDADYGMGAEIADATTIINNDYSQKTSSVAVFGQTEYDLSDKFTLITGIRFTRDDKDYEFHSTFKDEFNIFGAGVIVDPVPTFDYVDNRSADQWSGKIGLNWIVSDDTLVYFSYSRGTKAGGYSAPLDPTGLDADGDGMLGPDEVAAMEFGEETLFAYEIGIKSSLTDTLRLNAAAFYYDYRDYQAYNFVGLTQIIFNVDAEISGAEVELVSSPVDGLDLSFGIAVLDATALNVEAVGNQDTGIPLSPSFSANGVVRYEWPAFGGALAVQGDFMYVSDHNFNINEAPVLQEDGYGLLNARISYTGGDGRWGIAGFARNLTDKQYRVYGFDASADFGLTEEVVGNPLWWGITLNYRWN